MAETKLDKALSDITQAFGKGTVMSLNDKVDKMEVISTGSIGLDKALGVGGYAKGRIIEIFGPESSGKTTLAIHAIAEAQKQGGKCLYIDAEHSFDKSYAAALGVDVDNLYFNQPSNGEEGLEVAEKLISTGEFAVVVVDSVAALVPKAEIEGEMGENKMGLHARLMSQALRKLTHAVNSTNTVLIFINQLREKIGVMFGNPEVTTGGNALKFYASQRLDVRRSITAANSTKEGEETVANLVKVKIIKNKVAPPFRTCDFDIRYGSGIWKEKELLDYAVVEGLVKKSGSHYTYGDTKLGQGLAQVTAMLEDNPGLFEEIKSRLNAD